MGTLTEHYGLHQWEPEDDFLRTDFNEDNVKIEEALTTLAAGQFKIVTGTYTGTGNSYGTNQTINLGFRPKVVVLDNHMGIRNSGTYGGVFFDGAPLNSDAAKITNDGFSVQWNCNDSAKTYHYIAFG